MRKPRCAVTHRALTTVVTTTVTTVRLLDTHTYTTIGPLSCLVTPSACAYGSEGGGSNPFGRTQLSGPFWYCAGDAIAFFDDSLTI